MKLDPGEHTLMGAFHHYPRAEAAEKALRQAGYDAVQLDRIAKEGFDPGRNEERPGWGGEPSQVTATIYGHERMLGRDTRVLLGAMPENSGMAGPMTADMPSFLLTVVCKNERVDEAVRIMEEHGGRV